LIQSHISCIAASCSDDLTVRIWRDLDSAQQHKYSNVCTLTGHHTRTIFSVDFSPSGYLASGGGDDAIVIYRPSQSSPELPSTYEFAFRLDRAHQSDINCVAWSADNTLATVSDDQTVKVWRFTPPEV
jgi:WD40 repeat protein